MYNSCEICGSNNWKIVYEGNIRNMVYGEFIEGNIAECQGCCVERLNEDNCMQPNDYENDQYRVELKQGTTPEAFFHHSDITQIHNLNAFWPLNIRNKVVADIGVGAGSFIDHISTLTKNIIAVEPTQMYHPSLNKRGYNVYSYTSDALELHYNKVDYVFSFQVIEHVLNPMVFIKEAFSLLKPGGTLIIATPNRNDILLKLLPDDFPSFFYRRAHRWYFDRESLIRCVTEAGGGEGLVHAISIPLTCQTCCTGLN